MDMMSTMAKPRKTTQSARKGNTTAPQKPAKAGSLALSRWWNTHREELLRRAEANTIRLTGKPRL